MTVAVSVAALAGCAICAFGMAAYSGASAINNAWRGRWRDAAWDAVGAVSWGYGAHLNRAQKSAQAALQGVQRAGRIRAGTRNGVRYRRWAPAYRYARSRARRAEFRYDGWWHADYAMNSVSISRMVRDF